MLQGIEPLAYQSLFLIFYPLYHSLSHTPPPEVMMDCIRVVSLNANCLDITEKIRMLLNDLKHSYACGFYSGDPLQKLQTPNSQK